MPSLVLMVLASGLAALGLIFPAAWALTIVGLSLFFRVLWAPDLPLRTTLLYGWVFGSITGGAGVIWLLSIYPIARLGVTAPFLQIVLVGGTWLLTALVLGGAVALAAPLIRLAKHAWAPALAVALLWPLIELARMWAYALFTWGPHSFFGPHFSPAALGYVLTEQPYLLQFAHPAGLFALNGIIALIAGTGALISLQQDRRLQLAHVAILLAVLSLPLIDRYRAPEPNGTVRVALLSANDAAEEREQVATSTRLLLEQAAHTASDIVVFPEGYGLAGAYPNVAEGRATLAHLFDRETLLIDWSYQRSAEAVRTRQPGEDLIEYYSTTRGLLASYTKIYLMPVGEYEPLAFHVLYSLFDSPGFHRYLSYLDNAITKGDHVVTVPYHGTTLGALLCSDLLSPSLYRELGAAHADILINLGNQNWFHHAPILYGKTLQIAKTVAVQNRRPFLMANNSAPSFAVSAMGTLISQSSWNTPMVLVVDVPVRTGDQ
jgi:apolipoprotein N-acyltransferase